MPWNGSGAITLTQDFIADFNAGPPTSIITAAKMDEVLEDLADCIEACINRNGENQPTANINWGGYKITNLGAATAATDAVRARQVAENALQYGGTTGGSSNAYTVTNGFLTTPAAGTRLLVKANHTNTDAATVNVNSGGDVAIKRRDGSTALSSGEIVSGYFFELVYDGTFYRLEGGSAASALLLDGSTTMTGAAKFADGTAALPSMSFGTDTNTGIYRAGADSVGVAAGGASVATFSSAGVATSTVTATGALRSGAGSAAAPAITVGAETDTGFYRRAEDVIAMAIGGILKGNVDAFPTGTVMLFVQTAAPTGWTKSTDHNNKALRVVSGTASSGGSTAFTSVFAARTITQGNLPVATLTTTITDTHTHGLPASQAGTSFSGSGAFFTNSNGTNLFGSNATQTSTRASGGGGDITASTDLGGSGTAMDFAVQYVDVILAAKD